MMTSEYGWLLKNTTLQYWGHMHNIKKKNLSVSYYTAPEDLKTE